ncbi:sigma-54-dependent transcriptional regulator [Acidithiobacillus sulfuriphilus]|uniref:Sigma-54-dependent Fis family transcriptional regulator n=2 Tax=Acidithiobacillus sulfuriphilus TaxID=1867749 RepID=A0A3M8QV53_9PROT|nr:sigma-54 dependent transcriptional regulator [Acidithiobacillus sulfuriphilus]RNF60173.1 sigma-54-dependent Fis family transcriptional regulator [Acidithiobacillus sulfuriphilus]
MSHVPKMPALIVDDEPAILELLAITLEEMDLAVMTAASLREARAAIAQAVPLFCLTDLRLPDGSGMELVRLLHDRHPQSPVAVITAYSSAEGAVEAMQAGAFDYMAKPIDLARLRRMAEQAVALAGLAVTPASAATRLVGSSPIMQRLREKILLLGRSNAPVHIAGESGTGKELVARAIHEAGPRSDQPFIAVNCGAIPEGLVESEFFGAEKGAFSGAVQRREGLFAAANGGTLFLDEVGELPMPMQVKLLRAIQERAIRPLGAARELALDIRLISATHRDIGQMVAAGQFREDLYYRINVVPLQIPPLRERVEDLPELGAALLARMARAQGRPAVTLRADALAWLQRYPFPGNVRELENLLERALALHDGPSIGAADLQPSGTASVLPASAEGEDAAMDLDAAEARLLRETLERVKMDTVAAAHALGISLQSLHARLQKLHLEERP